MVIDSPVGWVNDHIRRYEGSDGADGHIWNGVPTLLLTTTGRRTGQPRRTALIYGQDGDAFVVVASKGGSREDPLWYRNLVADPHVDVQVADRRFAATARTADDEERARLWTLMTGIWPSYDQYQARTERRIPVVMLEPTAA
jgi:deazaflavin-dependent oxidoreductase (nitroreductase family)